MNTRWYFVQRLTALILAPLVLAHVILIIIAVRGGLTGAEILARTQGSFSWGIFYSVFVICVALHGGIGLRTILLEWTTLSAQGATLLAHTLMLLLLLLGLRAVYAVVAA